jgi:hypothetical protein
LKLTLRQVITAIKAVAAPLKVSSYAKGYLLKFTKDEMLQGALGKKVTVSKVVIKITRFFTNDNCVYYLDRFDALPLINVAKGISAATNNAQFHLRQVSIEGILVDAVVVGPWPGWKDFQISEREEAGPPPGQARYKAKDRSSNNNPR